MKNKKLLMRLLCALLSIVMLACMLPAITVSAADEEEEETVIDYTNVAYESAEARYQAMTEYYNDGVYALACDENIGVVAYKKIATGEILFTNPWDMKKETSKEESVRHDLMAQVILTYVDNKEGGKTLNSYTDAILKGQYAITPIQNGVRVEYAIGEISARILVPLRIERSSFEEKIMKPLEENLSSRNFSKFMAYYTLKKQGGPGIAAAYPVTEEKGIDIYVFNDDVTKTKVLRELEAWILAYCPDYSFAQMDEDYELVDFEFEATSPAVFRLALEYTVDANGLSVALPANGLRYDESVYRITDLQILPYMGASYKGNSGVDATTGLPIDGGVTYSGYTFIPDGSGALYDLNQMISRPSRVYGEDYALLSVIGSHIVPMRMPVYGQVEIATHPNGKTESRGFLAIIEEGESLASIAPNHSTKFYSAVGASFITRQSDTSMSSWSVYANRRYTDDYRTRYIILSDDAKAQAASLNSYYECSWMGMACAYRDYLDAKDNGFERLTAEDVTASIPLYIETFGCMDTVKKVMSIPVTVSVALTSFEDIETMYEYLIGEGVTNVNFKLTGYANGGLYSDVPYKLKWESSVGGKSGFKDLLEYAAEHPELGIFPDFDFVYTSGGGTSVDMKKYGARTIDNRYTAKRSYSVTQQTLVSYYQMVLSPATYSHFYEKLEKKYSKYENGAISLSTMGSDLNSSYAEEDTSLREDSKNYTIQALEYFTSRDYEVMVDGGNAFTWSYADYILDVPLTSNRYTTELSTVPFAGVVLHGYVQFASSALNLEGNLAYAMLKAMESGAGVYFLLSYTNTELLKDDILLSQNYSVRYDIWQARLVEIYKELNSVLADVQTKLIIDHELLDGTRVPDADELLQDAIDAANKEAAAVAERRENIALATTTLNQINYRMTQYKAELATKYAAMQALRDADSALMTAWDAYVADSTNRTVKQAFFLKLTTFVAEPMAELMMLRETVDALVEAAEGNYQFLVDTKADADVVANAKIVRDAIVVTYNEIVASYGDASENITFDRAKFLYGDATYANVSVEDLAALFVTALKGDLAVDDQTLDLENLIEKLAEGLVVKTEPVAGATNGTTAGNTDTSYKYAVDSDIVYVTYGDYVNGKAVAYKSFILNFNDYAVTTMVDGVVYHIAAYGYAVIMHNTNA